tara:strand:+ start:339 stop:905 length:567 start_codon:yes stop_codon:yes gene_type:complete
MPYRTFIDKKKEPEKKLKKLKKKKDKLKQKQKQQQKQSVVLNVSAGSSGGGGFIPQQQAPQIDYSLISNLLRPMTTIQQPFRETIAEPELLLPRRAEEPTLSSAKTGRPKLSEEERQRRELEKEAAREYAKQEALNIAGQKAYEQELEAQLATIESQSGLAGSKKKKKSKEVEIKYPITDPFGGGGSA